MNEFLTVVQEGGEKGGSYSCGFYFRMCGWNVCVQTGHCKCLKKKSDNIVRLLSVLESDRKKAFS